MTGDFEMLKDYNEATRGITNETLFNKVFSGEIKAYGKYNDPINPILEKLLSHRNAFQKQLTDDITFIKNNKNSDEISYWKYRIKAIESVIEKMDEVINNPLKRTWMELKTVLEEASLSNVLTKGKNLYQSVSDSTLFRDMIPDKFFHDVKEILKNYQFADSSELQSPVSKERKDKEISNTIVFKRGKATGWTIRMKDQENDSSYSHLTGFLYIQYLLLHPHKDIDCVYLNSLKNPGKPKEQYRTIDTVEVSNIPMELTNQETIDKLKLEYIRLKGEKEEIESKQSLSEKDYERVDEIEEKIKDIIKYIKRTSFKGKAKKENLETEKARKATCKAIKGALATISKNDSVSNFLNEQTIETGSVCRYNPDPNNTPAIETA
jgi:hypothetical protein